MPTEVSDDPIMTFIMKVFVVFFKKLNFGQFFKGGFNIRNWGNLTYVQYIKQRPLCSSGAIYL